MSNESTRKKLLLHICCAPDAAYIPDSLAAEWEVTCFFYNPNIYPEAEYQKRADEMTRLAKAKGYPLISAPYEPDRFDERTQGHQYEPEKSGRCSLCYRIRLEETARTARENVFDAFATVLTVSPHKLVDRINRIGEAVARDADIPYLPSDFKKQDGFRLSVLEARRLDLYRQDYCGCESSLHYRDMFKAACRQEDILLVRSIRPGIVDIQHLRKHLDRDGHHTAFLFYDETPTPAVFREAYGMRIFLEPEGNLVWRRKIFRKKGIRISEPPIDTIVNRDIFRDAF